MTGHAKLGGNKDDVRTPHTSTKIYHQDAAGSKFAIVAGVSFSQALYALPLAIATAPGFMKAKPRVRMVGWAGVGIAAAGLLVETLVL